jgi:hypothetical protein
VRSKVNEGLPLFSRAETGMSRRNFLGLSAKIVVGAAVGARIAGVTNNVTMGRAKPISADILDASVGAETEAILRGETDIPKSQILKAAIQSIADSGPAELRALASEIAELLPDGVQVVVDDKRRVNAHGAVTLDASAPKLTLYTAGDLQGLIQCNRNSRSVTRNDTGSIPGIKLCYVNEKL